MSYYKFDDRDVIYNTIEAYPKFEFQIYNEEFFLNNESKLSGTLTTAIKHVPHGKAAVSLYEMNVDRPAGQLIYPFVTKDGSLSSFSTISTSDYGTGYNYGQKITGSYPLSSSISRAYHADASTDRPYIKALKNTLNYYNHQSKHYAYSSASLDTTSWNKEIQAMTVLTIPSIFYGSSIKKGSVKVKFFVTGTLAAVLEDKNRNGELIQTTGSYGLGNVAGVALYNEGFLLLTGSWDLNQGFTAAYDDGTVSPKWRYFGAKAGNNSQYSLAYKGVTFTPTITMMARARKGELNHSNNPSFSVVTAITSSTTSSISYIQPEKIELKNTVKTPYNDPTGSFEKQTFISKIGIYDQNQNLIAIAKLATPVKKKAERDLTFRLKLDI